MLSIDKAEIFTKNISVFVFDTPAKCRENSRSSKVNKSIRERREAKEQQGVEQQVAEHERMEFLILAENQLEVEGK